MKRSRFTDKQSIGMIKKQESGIPTVQVCRKHGVSSASFYKYKAKFGGMEVSDAGKLKALEDENATSGPLEEPKEASATVSRRKAAGA